MHRIPHVALLIETSRAYGRGLLRGVIRYQKEHAPWSIYFQPHGLGAPPPPWLRRWHGDGILARIDDLAMARAVLQTGLPVVDLRFSVPNLGLPGVGIDNAAVVRLGFEHLAERGFQHFAWCGLPRGRNIWMDHRCDLFRALVHEAGRDCAVFGEGTRRAARTWEEEQERIAAWVARLPRPVGVMACHDDRGQQVLDACRRAGILVPDEVAVLGVDNDEILCNLSSPPLSSVDLDTQQVGYEAAALLDRLMAGKPAPAGPILLPPRGVVCRQSTDVLAIEDRELAEVVRYIREHACEGLRIQELVKRTSFSRRGLERRMQQVLGRSPKEEITRVQINRARQLLLETDLPAAVVAQRCGFRQAKYFSQVFHGRVGLPPGEYRRTRGTG